MPSGHQRRAFWASSLIVVMMLMQASKVAGFLCPATSQALWTGTRVSGLGGQRTVPALPATELWAAAPGVPGSAGGASPRHMPREEWKAARAVNVVSVVPGGGAKGALNASWVEVMEHMNRRMGYVDPSFSLTVVTAEELASRGTTALPPQQPDLMYFLSVQDDSVAEALRPYVDSVPHVISLNCSSSLQSLTRIGPARPHSRLSKLWRRLPLPTKRKELLKIYDTVLGFWERGYSDDMLYLILVVINGAITNIPAVSEILKPVTAKALSCMVCNCRQAIVNCQKNPVCKAALACLEKCPPNDQVCRYRCIVQYETPEFEEFALCILQKHNCLSNYASIQMRPDPAPIATFRNQPLTHELAEDLLFAWIGDKPWSWKVVCGQNPAYDFFPGQHMLFYRRKKQVWYVPVFAVKTYDDRLVWRRRQYRVRRGKVPGTFYFSVLDNGVTSMEYWRIVAVADDLSWILYYYSGAASAAGQSYQGAIFASPDGAWPLLKEAYMGELVAALDRCGIKMWELFQVKHDVELIQPPPLAVDEGWEGAKIRVA